MIVDLYNKDRKKAKSKLREYFRTIADPNKRVVKLQLCKSTEGLIWIETTSKKENKLPWEYVPHFFRIKTIYSSEPLTPYSNVVIAGNLEDFVEFFYKEFRDFMKNEYELPKEVEENAYKILSSVGWPYVHKKPTSIEESRVYHFFTENIPRYKPKKKLWEKYKDNK